MVYSQDGLTRAGIAMPRGIFEKKTPSLEIGNEPAVEQEP
jgi:hypothetical protein